MQSTLNSKTYEEGAVYVGKVTDQTLTKSGSGEVQLLLTVTVEQRLKNPKDASAGAEACPPGEREVRLNFPENEDRLARTIRELDRLGFSGDDVDWLHPDHPSFFSLVGTKIHVRKSIVGAVEYFNLFWPPSALGAEEAKAAAASLRDKIAAARKKLKNGGKGEPAGEKASR